MYVLRTIALPPNYEEASYLQMAANSFTIAELVNKLVNTWMKKSFLVGEGTYVTQDFKIMFTANIMKMQSNKEQTRVENYILVEKLNM